MPAPTPSEVQLSLEESEHSVLDEAGEAPVVQEAVSDAASDEDIEAEELRIAAEDAQTPSDPEVQT